MTTSVDGAGFTVNPALLVDSELAETLPTGVYPIDEDTGKAPIPDNRLELFRVSGKAYTVPKVADPRLIFRFIRALRGADNEVMAGARMMDDVLGTAVVDALAEEQLEPEQMAAVMKAVNKYMFSAMQRSGLGN